VDISAWRNVEIILSDLFKFKDTAEFFFFAPVPESLGDAKDRIVKANSSCSMPAAISPKATRKTTSPTR
jgi:hypothetical protein